MVTLGSATGFTGGRLVNVHRMLAIGQALYFEMNANFLDTFVRRLFRECRIPRNVRVRTAFDVGRGRKVGGMPD
jgi:hypothetical protein